MKSKFLLLMFVLVTLFSMAQNGISFQGIARDAQGMALSSKSVIVKFTIGTFNETQTLTTDNFGVFSAVIGSVNTTGFGNLVFANVTDNLKVEVDGTTIYDDKFNYAPYAKAAENGVPVGSIMPWAGAVTSGNALEEVIPGWVVCNGATLSSDGKYAKLKTVLGSSWGTNKVPDLRGTFLRGVNNGRTDGFNDPDAANRVAVNSGNTGDKVGSFEGDAYKSHNHTGTNSTDGAHTHTYTNYTGWAEAGGSYWQNIVTRSSSEAANTSSSGNHSHTVTINNAGGNETRPVNAGVNFIIKY
ncbi:MAG: tail fiber protein [Prolixibacteraceae bacterium]|nr:tail fiber protein [Prolixibacteraceae bacterium]